MSLEVLLQAAQYVDHPTSTGSSSGVTETSCQAMIAIAPAASRSTSSILFSDSKGVGDISQQQALSGDGYYRQDGVGKKSRSTMDADDAGNNSNKRNCKTTPMSRQTSSSETSGISNNWKQRADNKNKPGVMKHNTENRSVHNVLEKNRRAHLKDCFEALKQEVMDSDDDKKASHLAVLRSAVRCIQQLQKEGDKHQKEAEGLSKERTTGQLRLQELKREILAQNPAFDIAACLRDNSDDVDSQITCTAPGSPAPTGRYSSSPQRHLPHRSSTPIYTLSSLKISPPLSSPDSLPEIQISRVPRRKNEHQQQRKSPAKISVAKILHEAKSSPPTTNTMLNSSPPSSASSAQLCNKEEPPKRHLPIKLRIKQDQQEGLFSTSEPPEVVKVEEDVSSSSSPPAIRKTMPYIQYQPGDIPIPAMFTTAQGAFWAADGCPSFPAFYAPQNGYPATPMYQMNQFLVPITAVNGMVGGNGMTLPPGMFMLPAAGNGHGQAMFQYGQLPTIVNQMPAVLHQQRPPS